MIGLRQLIRSVKRTAWRFPILRTIRESEAVAVKSSRVLRTLTERTRILEERMRAIEASALLLGATSVTEMGSLLRPLPNGHSFERIGSTKDGGYVVPTDLPSPVGVISIGVGPECSADVALAERGARVWQCDHTVEASPAEHRNITFHRIGLGIAHEAAKGGHTRPLSELLELAHVTPDDSVWLMLDAEGVEWDVLLDRSAPLDRFDLIVVELHRLSWLARPGTDGLLVDAIRRLRETHSPIAWNPNNYAPTVAIGGLHVPDVLEVTFVANRRFDRDSTRSTASAAEFAHPNNPFGPESPEPFSPVPANPYGPTPLNIAARIDRVASSD